MRALESKQPSDSPGKLEDFGSQLAQLRERMTELDRAVTALSDHMANLSHQDTETVTETDGEKFVDLNSFNVIQGLLGQLQQEHERLMGTAAHLSHELDINKEHVKVWSVSLGEDLSWPAVTQCCVAPRPCMMVWMMSRRTKLTKLRWKWKLERSVITSYLYLAK